MMEQERDPGRANRARALVELLWANRSLREKGLVVSAIPLLTLLAVGALSSIQVGLVAAFVAGTTAMLLFTADVARRVKRNEQNSRRLAEGEALLPRAAGGDEVGRVGMALQASAELLAQRQAALAESEARYRTLIQNFPNGAVALFDRDLRYTLIEGKALGVLGLSKDTFEGKTLWEALGSEANRTQEESEQLWRAALRGETNVREAVFRDRTFLMQYVPVESEGGEVIAGMLVALDITERKRAEDELRHAESFLSSVVENIPNMVFVKSAQDLRFVRFNKAGEELLGFARQELLGRNDYDFFPEEEADFFTAKDREVLDRRRLVDIPEEPVETKERGRRYLHTRKIPLLDADGRPEYLLGISEDITERKEADELLRQAKDQAERANRAKDEFLSRMSHELRTPLNAVLGFAQVLDLEELPPQQRESVRQILGAGRHLLGLIDEALDITRIATGRMAMSPEAVSVTEAFSESADLIRPMAVEREIRLRVEDANGLHVLADRQRLKQVLLNLLSNGVKYNREGGEVSVSWEKATAGRLRIKVADTGTGIPAEAMERLFAPFDRLGAESSGVEGTGLGLSLTKGLIEAMGGTIEVESVLGSGSTFSIELALAEPPLDRLGRESAPGPEKRSRDGSGSTVLYIEDNLSNLKLIERIFSGRSETTLISAMQASLGLRLAIDHRPDLILLDLHLPDMPGDEALRRLRENPTTRSIPVVMISADATQSQMKRLLAAGADDYLTKPLNIQRFLGVVDVMLAGRRVRR